MNSEHLDLHQGSREAAALQAGGIAALPYSVNMRQFACLIYLVPEDGFEPSTHCL